MTLARATAKPKKCRNPVCRRSFAPLMSTQKVCSWACGLAIAPAEREKVRKSLAQVERREIRARREKLKTKADHMRETQTIFNQWVRLRDAGKPCVSCGTTADVQYAAGHFRPTGSNPALRFEPLNVHLQCNRNCNMAKSGNLGPYRIELIRRIGLERVEWLEGPHEPQRYTIEDLKAIKAKYRALIREMKGRATA